LFSPKKDFNQTLASLKINFNISNFENKDVVLESFQGFDLSADEQHKLSGILTQYDMSGHMNGTTGKVYKILKIVLDDKNKDLLKDILGAEDIEEWLGLHSGFFYVDQGMQLNQHTLKNLIRERIQKFKDVSLKHFVEVLINPSNSIDLSLDLDNARAHTRFYIKTLIGHHFGFGEHRFRMDPHIRHVPVNVQNQSKQQVVGPNKY
jgi:hypothetical protein